MTKREQELSEEKKAADEAKAAEDAAKKPPTAEQLLTQIRDLLEKEK
jgi:large-conductance mechanosensitive channel